MFFLSTKFFYSPVSVESNHPNMEDMSVWNAARGSKLHHVKNRQHCPSNVGFERCLSGGQRESIEICILFADKF